MTRAAIVGLGRWGRRLVDSVQALGTVSALRFTHAVVRTLESNQAYAQLRGLQLVSSLSDVLQDPAVDAVVLATPHELHAAQAMQVLAAGKHVFVEKPLALNDRDAREALAAARQANRVLAVGHNRRFLPATHAMQELVQSGRLGRILHVEANFSNASGLAYNDAMWRSGEHGAMAAMTAMGVHSLDLLVALCGPLSQVRARGNRIAMPVEADDVVAVEMTFRSGVTGYLSTLLTTPRQWRVQMFGTQGWAHMRDEHLLDICDAQGEVTTRDFGPTDTLRRELEAFAAAITGAAVYPIADDDMVHVPGALAAVLKSVTSGEAVAIL
jgi:predicted dehydrogenase